MTVANYTYVRHIESNVRCIESGTRLVLHRFSVPCSTTTLPALPQKVPHLAELSMS